MSSDGGQISELILANSTEKFSIEYGPRRLSNHLSHGLIALHRLGASKQKLERFLTWYQQFLDPSTEEDPAFKSWLESYEAKKGSLSNLVKEQFPGVASGLCAALFHGLIQLGYGVSAGSVKVACEGLAYIRFAYVQPQLPLEELRKPMNGTEDPLKVLQLLQEDLCLQDALEIKFFQGTGSERFASIFEPTIAAALLKLVDQIKLPGDVPNALVKTAAIIYSGSAQKNNFFLLHGVTAAWSLKQVLAHVSDLEAINVSTRVFLLGLLAVYGAVGAPAIELSEETSKSWPELLEETLSFETDRDEHVYKLVQVCLDMATELDQEDSFYRAVAEVALKFELRFN